MLAVQQTTQHPTTNLPISNPPSRPIPIFTGPDASAFADAFTTVAASILSTTPPHNWSGYQHHIVKFLKILRKAVHNSDNTPPNPKDSWWKTYFNTIHVILETAQVNSMQEFCDKIQAIKKKRQVLKEHKKHFEKCLVQLIDTGSYDNMPTSPSVDSSKLMDDLLVCLDDFDKALHTINNNLLNFGADFNDIFTYTLPSR